MNDSNDRVLILGGYGAVGREAAAELVASGLQVRLAGRHPERARSVPGTELIEVDLADNAQVAAALDGTDIVLMCAERNNAEVARACFERGVHYLDVTATHSVIAELEQLHELAATNKAVGVLSVGLAPGVTNLLARHAVENSTERSVRIGALLGSGEAHGPAAVRWTLDGLGALTGSWQMDFPGGPRTVHRFPFSDQYTLPRTLGIDHAETGFALDSRALTAALASARLPVLGPMMRSSAAQWLLGHLHIGSDRIVVRAESGSAAATFAGNRQSRATGLVAALLVRRLFEFPVGVRHIEQLVDPAEFLNQLTVYGFELDLSESIDPE